MNKNKKDVIRDSYQTRVLIDTIAGFKPDRDCGIRLWLRSGDKIILSYTGRPKYEAGVKILDSHFNILT